MSAAVGAQPMSRREQNKAANRAAILAAARRLFIERGFESVNIRDIVRGTHLAAGTFYNYFPDKESVFRALVDEQMASLTVQLTEIRQSATSLDVFLHATYALVFRTALEEPLFYQFIFRNQAVMQDMYEGSVLGLSVHALRQDIEAAQQRGLIDSAIDADYLAAAFYGVGFELGREMVSREQPDPEAVAALATRIFLAGVAPRR
ncbi:MAG: TetR/AcrR family transcriptional regulator [Abyssibacter sp.]|uniref:TetR/AcrR family transcriptional regulator n=1 Tax=Abyssibacter sp. TaxID=2320200 RepID=UPI002EB597DC|nr:TetR/AcrR family transcriptional regulator [Pseudomonadota bacterium]